MPTLPCKRARPPPSPEEDGDSRLHFPAVFELLLELKPRALRRSVKAGEDAPATLLFECADSEGELLRAPCHEFVEWVLGCVQADVTAADSVDCADDDLCLLFAFAEHEGLRGVLLRCCLLPPFICLAFRLYFDMRRAAVGDEDARRAELWLQLLLLLLFKLCDLDDQAPVLMLKSLQSSGSDDFAYVVHSLMQVAADNLSGSAPPLDLPSPGGGGGGFMSKCAASLSKGRECVGCLAVDLCSMLCCSSPESVSYTILSQALKPSLVMNLTLLLFQRLSSHTLQHAHERLAVSWLVLRHASALAFNNPDPAPLPPPLPLPLLRLPWRRSCATTALILSTS